MPPYFFTDALPVCPSRRVGLSVRPSVGLQRLCYTYCFHDFLGESTGQPQTTRMAGVGSDEPYTGHRRRARAFSHFVVLSGSVVHWRPKDRERKAKKKERK